MIYKGPKHAKIILLGEAPGAEELRKGIPFVGPSGWELDKMLEKAGISPSTCFFFNVTDWRPAHDDGFFLKKTEGKKSGAPFFKGKYLANPIIAKDVQKCLEVIAEIKPNVVIALGALALWAITNEEGITKWRGSILESVETPSGTFKVIPTYNPAFVLKNWPTREIVIQDFRRAFQQSFYPEIRYPSRNYLLRPTFDQAIDAIERARGQEITNDLEVWNENIACVGIGYNKNEAACIPFATTERPEGYWLEHEEHEIVLRLKSVLTDPLTKVIFQNGHFDLQIYAKEWGYLPNITDDTMVAMHVAYPAMRKALDFIASLTCDYYRFWKEDGKYWNPATHSEEQYWSYNCDDCVYTYECMEVLRKTISAKKLERPYEIQMSLILPTLKMMLRGVKIDIDFKNEMKGELMEMMRERSEWFETVLGHPLNPLSNAPTGQMRKLFYDDLKVPPIISRKTRRSTLDDEALETLKKRNPLLAPLINACQEYRSLNTFKSNFADMKVSLDNRMRCSINISKVETYRFSTQENIWGEGSNLQNIPKGSKEN